MVMKPIFQGTSGTQNGSQDITDEFELEFNVTSCNATLSICDDMEKVPKFGIMKLACNTFRKKCANVLS